MADRTPRCTANPFHNLFLLVTHFASSFNLCVACPPFANLARACEESSGKGCERRMSAFGRSAASAARRAVAVGGTLFLVTGGAVAAQGKVYPRKYDIKPIK